VVAQAAREEAVAQAEIICQVAQVLVAMAEHHLVVAQ
jgi:hypothetical protein